VQGAVLLHWDNPLAGAFCQLRFGARGSAYGAFDAAVDVQGIVARSMPG
jgi:putative acyl-CoA dehydrogenase